MTRNACQSAVNRRASRAPRAAHARHLGARRRADDARLPAADAAHLRGLLVVPDRAHGDHVAAAHEPRDSRRPGSGSTTSAPCSTTRCCRWRSGTPLEFALLALIFGYPDPARRGRPDERGAPLPRHLQRARLPAGRDPAGGRGAALEDVLRRRARRASSTRSSAGSTSGRTRGCSRRDTAMPSLVLESTWANAGAHRHHLPGRADRRQPRAVRGRRRSTAPSLWRKVWHITMPQLRGVLLLTMILQIIGTAQVFLEPYLFTSGGPTNSTLTVLLLIYNYAFGNSLGGDYGSATALSLMLAVFLAVLLARLPAGDALVEHDVRRRRRPATGRAPSSSPACPARAADWRRPRRALGRRRRAGRSCSSCSSSSGSARCCGCAKSAITPTQTRSRTRWRSSRTASAWSNLREAWSDVQVEPLLLEHRRARVRLVAVADHRRDDRRLRAVGAAAALRARSSRAWC